MTFRLGLVALIALGCASAPPPSPSPASSPSVAPSASALPTVAPPTDLTLMTHDAFAVSDDVKKEFEDANHVTVKVLKSGDAGAMINQAILAKNAPLADVLYGVDNTFLSRALDAGIFEPYTSPALSAVPTEFQLDPTHAVTPIDFGDVCLNYDVSAFTGNPPAPTKLADLIDPKYKNMLVVENPATSSPGLAFVLATVARLGDVPGATAIPRPSGVLDWHGYWQQLRANGVLVSDGWDDAYYNQFSGATGGGDRPIVVSYATSPAAEIVFAPTPAPSTSPTANITDGCFRQVEFAGVLANGRPEAKALAQKWIDFMLSKRFQEDMPLQMFVFPANKDAAVPDVFSQTNAKAPDPIEMDPATIGRIRDQVIQEWTDVVLR